MKNKNNKNQSGGGKKKQVLTHYCESSEGLQHMKHEQGPRDSSLFQLEKRLGGGVCMYVCV